ncbi:hypothetical protein WISP_109141 [Willisornis vidua]|uniref:Rna-directed dna polymerase from mobile element jockey-like n=1 Tax=Willisornis vidua TaxID=1566151 RepID=A0ABQ9D241_9PASS|nr:hypothetical protein WISP_109141 [Willisornis vidua]
MVHKSMRSDGVHLRVLREPLSIIFQKSKQFSEVLTDWNRGNITPIFTKGKKEDMGNYGLVSLTFMPSKIMEQILLETVLRHMENKEMIDGQHDFRKGNMCLSNLAAFYGEVTVVVNEGRATDAICVDLYKAFDTVLHDIRVL